MQCAACKKDGVLAHEHRYYCKGCYVSLMERRVKRYCRKHQLINKGDVLSITNPLVRHIVEQVVQGMPVAYSDAGRPVLLWTLDDENAAFLQGFLEKDFAFENSEAVYLLRCLTDEELATYAKIKGFTFTPREKKGLLDGVLEKYPLMKYSLATTIEDMREILQ